MCALSLECVTDQHGSRLMMEAFVRENITLIMAGGGVPGCGDGVGLVLIRGARIFAVDVWFP